MRLEYIWFWWTFSCESSHSSATGGKQGWGNWGKSNSFFSFACMLSESATCCYLSAQISFPQKHYRAQRGGGWAGLFHNIIHMMWIEEADRILRCSDIFKVSHKRQTRQLEENHYSPSGKYASFSRCHSGLENEKETYAQGRCVCFYAW